MSYVNPGRGGFTFIELLTVLLILGILVAMTMSLLGVGRTAALRTQSQGIMRKVDAALRQFKVDFKGYPYQAHYPDLAAGERWHNRLYYQIGTDIADEDRDRVVADMDTAAAQYAYDCRVAEPAAPTAHMFRANRGDGQRRKVPGNVPEGDDAPQFSYQNSFNHEWYFCYNPNGDTNTYNQVSRSTCVMLNRMASERARVLMLIGAVDSGGVTMTDVTGGGGIVHKGRDVSGVPLVASPQSEQRPGWAVDYLKGELETRYFNGDEILDAWRNPLIYICQVKPGSQGSLALALGYTTNIPSPGQYGLAPIGRKTLRSTNSDGTPMPPDGDALPDPMNPRHSDITQYATRGYELEFELWSSGPDGKFGKMRDDRENRDNIPCDKYDDGIGR
jgi:prepilin-type N-terminal cleavage/methylation domain-containing protein